MTTELPFAILASSSRGALNRKGKKMDNYTATIFVNNERLSEKVGFYYVTRWFDKMHDAQDFAIKEIKKTKYNSAYHDVSIIVEKIGPDARYIAKYKRYATCITRNGKPVEWVV